MTIQKRSRRFKLTAVISAAAAAAAVTALASPTAGAVPARGVVYGTGVPGAVAGSYLVTLDKQTYGKSDTRADKKELADSYGGRLTRAYDSAVDGFAAAGLTETEAKRLAADPAVDKVVQNHTFSVDATQDNPPSWGLDRIDQTATTGDNAYTYPDSAGQGVTAYVIDTGVRITHQDFGGRATYGYDAVDDDNTADDGYGHGTHVAGTIAGTEHGVAKNASIVAVRVLDDTGHGTTEQVVAGVDWVTAHHQGPSVANMSLGGPPDPIIDQAVRGAIASGVTFGVAAGNDTLDASQSSPADVGEAITVAAADQDDSQSVFSNFGPLVDLYAPGSNIVSDYNTADDATTIMSGTSMATPHVVGAAALYLAGHPEATPAEVATALTGGATPDAITNATEGTPNKLLKIIE
ncbi:serine protease [Streptomyces sp. 150FB]|uniref:S8 family peptidase n=1 Tax=Streptomyces sp. 150FB TaxID=1576605 RepID=UPI000589256C|nr:S8 family peptidase [Streptomyces sp. 150FB]KIF77412.1 serine protease [Streptomyces sp. 150FB]